MDTTNSTTPDNPIERAISIVGSQRELGEKLGVGQSAISQWKLGMIAVEVKHYPSFERVTRGKVTRRHLIDFELRRLQKVS